MVGNECARPVTADQVALAHEPGIGIVDGEAGDPKLASELTGGWHARSRSEGFLLDGRQDAPVDLFHERYGIGSIDGNHEIHGVTTFCWTKSERLWW